jgi:hypothetical protein
MSGIERLSNDDVQWSGTGIGLVPTLSDPAVRILDQGEAAIPGLLDALGDDARFALAHVLLTNLSGMPYETVPWNGLEVDIEPDGTVRVDPAQRPALERRWRRWTESRPRPRELPK